MARIRVTTKPAPTRIDRFLGINEDTSGETQLQLGESPSMINYQITENYKLRKREGYKQLFEPLGEFKIRGMWYGKIGDQYHFLFATNGRIYRHDFETGTNEDIGELTDDDTFFFAHDGNVYILNGHEYKKWTGTGTITDVIGYRPLVAINAPPTGGGTIYEDMNLLTGAKRMTFSPDKEGSVTFQLPEKDINSVDFVKVSGINVSPTSTDLANGTVTVDISSQDLTEGSVEIGWTKQHSMRPIIEKMKRAVFYNGATDARIFLYGDGTNRAYYSGLAGGVPSAEYFTEFGFITAGSDEYAITDMIPQYSRLMIYKENSAYFATFDIIEDELGNAMASFPVYNMNYTVGNVALGQTQLVRNNPFTIDRGVREWIPRDVRDENNEFLISKRIQPSLSQIDLRKVITFDWQDKMEYWLCYEKEVWVYNYRLDVWYKYELADEPTCFIAIDKKLYFGTTKGTVMCFDYEYKDDNGVPIKRHWEMHFYDWERESNYKNMNMAWVTIKPEVRTGVYVTYQTNVSAYSMPVKMSYSLMTYAKVDYGHWSYSTNYNPQPFPIEVDTEPFVYFKIILDNENTHENETILSISLGARLAGEVD